MEPTVESRIHPAHINKQAYHGHVHSSAPISQKLFLQNLACLATSSHGVHVDIGERMAARAVVSFGEDASIVLENAS